MSLYPHHSSLLLYLTCVHKTSQTYEGGYGQTPEGESLGGPTYCALAALHLVPADHACAPQARLQRAEWHTTVRWLLHMQAEALASVGGGGFAGRTNKLADACYGFWCGAALAVRPVSLPVGVGVCGSSSAVPMGRPRGTPGFLQIRFLALESCSMRARSARFSRSASTNLVGSAKHRANILVSLRLLSPPLPLGIRALLSSPNATHSLAILMTIQIHTTRICRSQLRRSLRQILPGGCNHSTRSSMRHTRRRGGQRNTYLPRPSSQNGSMCSRSYCCCLVRFGRAIWEDGEPCGLVTKESYSNGSYVQLEHLSVDGPCSQLKIICKGVGLLPFCCQ